MTTLFLPAPTKPPAITPPEELSSLFHSLNTSSIDEEGIPVPQAIIKARDGSLTVMAAQSMSLLYSGIAMQFWKFDPQEIIFGWDRFALAGQGIEFQDFLSVHHWRYGAGWRYGVINYQVEPLIVRPIEWDHPFWTPVLNRETMRNLKGLGILAEELK